MSSSSVYVCILRTRVYIVLCTSGTRARGSVGGDGFGEEELGKQEDEVVDEMYGVLSCGLFKLQSKLNHSCAPNARIVCAFTDGSIDLVACEEVRCGDELLNAYIDPREQDGARRRSMLRSSYGFECGCARCAREKKAGNE